MLPLVATRVANPIQSNRQSNPIEPFLDNRQSKFRQSIIRMAIQSKSTIQNIIDCFSIVSSIFDKNRSNPIDNPIDEKCSNRQSRIYSIGLDWQPWLPPTNIWKWINAIRREQGLVEVKQAKFLAGDKPSKRTKNSANEDGLTNLVLSYFHRSPMEFLQGIAHRLTFGTN